MDSNCPICDRPSPSPLDPCSRCRSENDIPGDRTYSIWSTVRSNAIDISKSDQTRKTSLEKTDKEGKLTKPKPQS